MMCGYGVHRYYASGECSDRGFLLVSRRSAPSRTYMCQQRGCLAKVRPAHYYSGTSLHVQTVVPYAGASIGKKSNILQCDFNV
ncbi:hypothetical protein MMALV_03840 [Candidatus Methanomethylophilus alvi Mx1201]|uniref:Uncharacterized protein n=1 Tax=Methanomethylophilus alvi (strain Mx1201) TaxID=1236689 RepID=M9SBF3_METAX|nr:hypothetical protein MMALV_03840 [Candidatus Methanomethylophilus alvi Mx1201]